MGLPGPSRPPIKINRALRQVHKQFILSFRVDSVPIDSPAAGDSSRHPGIGCHLLIISINFQGLHEDMVRRGANFQCPLASLEDPPPALPAGLPVDRLEGTVRSD